MALNPSIIQGLKQFQIDSPDESLVKSLTIKDLMRKSQESEFAAQDAQTARRDKITLNDLYSSSLGANGKLDRNALLTGAAQRGLGSQIPGLQKNFAADDKAQGELSETAAKTSKTRSEVLKMTLERSRDSLNTINDPIAAEQWVRANYANPELAEVTKHGNVDQAVAGIPKDAEGFQQWKLQSGLSAEKMIQFTTPDANAQLSARTSTANNAATVANSARNADLVNARGLEANDIKAREIDQSMAPSGLSVLGVPMPGVLPWANQSNSKDANKVKAQEQVRGAKEIEKDVDAAKKEGQAAAAAKRFLELNRSTATGGLTDRMGLTRGIQGLGANYAEMESITARLSPAMREPGSGSTSDFDGKQFERATVGVDKPAKTNTNIAQGIIARAKQAEEYADFRQTYLEQNGTLQGADRFWKDYANKNPIFDPTKEGTFEINANRKPWAEHFKTSQPRGAAAPSGAGQEGAVSKSKSGKDIVMRNGQWEYK